MKLPAYMRSRRAFWIGGVLVIAAIAAVFFARSGGTSHQTLVVHPAQFARQLSVSGTVVAAHDVDLGFSQSGRISGVYATVGDVVPAGRLLAEVENGDLRATVAQRQAALASEQAKLGSLLAGTRPEEVAVKEAQVESDRVALSQSQDAEMNALRDAYSQSDDAIRNRADQFFNAPRTQSTTLAFGTSDAQLKIRVETERVSLETELDAWQQSLSSLSPDTLDAAEALAVQHLAAVSAFLSDANQALNLASYTSTYTQSVISGYITSIATGRANVNATHTALQSAETARQAAAATLNKDEKDLALERAGATQQDIDAQRAQVAAAQADVANAQAQLGKTEIFAPFGGTVTRVDAKVGAIASPTESDIAMISNGLFQIQVYVPEVSITGLSVHDPATTTLDAYGSSVEFPATVIAIDPAETIKDGVSTYKTTLQFLAPDARIKSGMTASVIITTATAPNALIVPGGAIFTKNGQKMVQLERGNTLVDVPVTVDETPSLGNVHVLSGLNDGDIVVLDPDSSR